MIRSGQSASAVVRFWPEWTPCAAAAALACSTRNRSQTAMRCRRRGGDRSEPLQLPLHPGRQRALVDLMRSRGRQSPIQSMLMRGLRVQARCAVARSVRQRDRGMHPSHPALSRSLRSLRDFLAIPVKLAIPVNPPIPALRTAVRIVAPAIVMTRFMIVEEAVRSGTSRGRLRDRFDRRRMCGSRRCGRSPSAGCSSRLNGGCGNGITIGSASSGPRRLSTCTESRCSGRGSSSSRNGAGDDSNWAGNWRNSRIGPRHVWAANCIRRRCSGRVRFCGNQASSAPKLVLFSVCSTAQSRSAACGAWITIR